MTSLSPFYGLGDGGSKCYNFVLEHENQKKDRRDPGVFLSAHPALEHFAYKH